MNTNHEISIEVIEKWLRDSHKPQNDFMAGISLYDSRLNRNPN